MVRAAGRKRVLLERGLESRRSARARREEEMRGEHESRVFNGPCHRAKARTVMLDVNVTERKRARARWDGREGGREIERQTEKEVRKRSSNERLRAAHERASAHVSWWMNNGTPLYLRYPLDPLDLPSPPTGLPHPPLASSSPSLVSAPRCSPSVSRGLYFKRL